MKLYLVEKRERHGFQIGTRWSRWLPLAGHLYWERRLAKGIVDKLQDRMNEAQFRVTTWKKER